MVAARYFGSCASNSTKLGNGWELCRDKEGTFARRTVRDPGLYRFPHYLDPPAHAITVVCLDAGQDLTQREYRHNGLVIGHRRAQIDGKPFPQRQNEYRRSNRYSPIPEGIISALGRKEEVAA